MKHSLFPRARRTPEEEKNTISASDPGAYGVQQAVSSWLFAFMALAGLRATFIAGRWHRR